MKPKNNHTFLSVIFKTIIKNEIANFDQIRIIHCYKVRALILKTPFR